MIRNTSNGWGSVSRWLHWILALTIVGFAIYVFAAFCYIVALKRIPVSVAFPSVAASYAIVAVLAHLLWNEPFGWPQIAGLVLIGTGIGAPHPRGAVEHGAAVGGVVVHVLGARDQARSGLERAVGRERKPIGFEIVGNGGRSAVIRVDATRKLLCMYAADAYEDRHILFAYVLLALIAVHVIAALWHHFIRRDRVVARMVTDEAG